MKAHWSLSPCLSRADYTLCLSRAESETTFLSNVSRADLATSRRSCLRCVAPEAASVEALRLSLTRAGLLTCSSGLCARWV